jgi:hypothetical protein
VAPVLYTAAFNSPRLFSLVKLAESTLPIRATMGFIAFSCMSRFKDAFDPPIQALRQFYLLVELVQW